ncbi:MAG: hypothetical protein ABW279_05690 [Acidimicrobiales bacterium]
MTSHGRIERARTAAVLFVHDPFPMLFPIWLIVVSITLLVTTRRRDRAAA